MNVSVEEAQHLLLDTCQIMREEKVDITHSLNRVICRDITAPENIPPFARSAYDGYAFRAEDTAGASEKNPVVLKVLEVVPAGFAPSKKVVPGTATKIMTGAPIPEGANAVINYEVTERTEEHVKLFFPCRPGDNVIPAGEDIKINQLVIPEGTVVTPPVTGLLASMGVVEVPVFKCPAVAVVSTGDELINVDEPLKPAKIRNSNAYSLHAYISSLGAKPVMVGTARDRLEEVAGCIERGLGQADLVVTTGGVSMGDYDVIVDALESLGAEPVFRKINIKPGSPSLAAVKDGKIILCLSGNPGAALVVFQLLGVPLIKKMSGQKNCLPEKVLVALDDEYPKKSPKRRFLRGNLVLENGELVAKLTGEQGNAVLRSMVGCNTLLDVPEGSGPLGRGIKLTAHLVDKIEQFGRE